MSLRALEEQASGHFTFADLCHCSETWRLTAVDNVPREAGTFDAMARLCEHILEPVVATFGKPVLTYGFAAPALTRLIKTGIAPKLDQHAGHERNRSGTLICPRLGQAVDFQVPGAPTSAVARFIAEATPFDRLYFYGDDRPLHVSCGPDDSRALVGLAMIGGRRLPRRLRLVDLSEGELARTPGDRDNLG